MKKILLALVILTGFTFANSDKDIFSLPVRQDDTYKVVAEVMPTIVGGIDALTKSIVYPDAAKNGSVKGKVYVLVMINEKGDVADAKVIKGIGSGCDEAAVAAIKKAKFTPAKDKGTAVKIKYALAVEFK